MHRLRIVRRRAQTTAAASRVTSSCENPPRTNRKGDTMLKGAET